MWATGQLGADPVRIAHAPYEGEEWREGGGGRGAGAAEEGHERQVRPCGVREQSHAARVAAPLGQAALGPLQGLLHLGHLRCVLCVV